VIGSAHESGGRRNEIARRHFTDSSMSLLSALLTDSIPSLCRQASREREFAVEDTLSNECTAFDAKAWVRTRLVQAGHFLKSSVRRRARMLTVCGQSTEQGPAYGHLASLDLALAPNFRRLAANCPLLSAPPEKVSTNWNRTTSLARVFNRVTVIAKSLLWSRPC
jgi:hypothetical protein